MTKRMLPALNALRRPESMEPGSAPVNAFDRWIGGLTLCAALTGTVIDITDVIGIDPWTGEGVDTAFVLSRLRAAGSSDVTVNINSPGGDYFEGAAIYELLRGHPGAVTVNIIGLAASAASIIAMAGDQILIGQTAFMMIHNCWGVCIGDRNDMTACAKVQGQVDAAMQSVYSDRSKQDTATVLSMMDDETWLGAKDAIDQGFADAILPAGTVTTNMAAAVKTQPIIAQRRLDAMMASHGTPRAERRRLFSEIKHGKPGAAVREGMHDAARLSAIADELRSLKSHF